MGIVRKWLTKAHQKMRQHRGYSRGAQALMNRYGHKIRNPHVRSLAQDGINRLSQAGYGRYCRGKGAYTKRKCKALMVTQRPNGKMRYHCGSYTKRVCKPKITRVRRLSSRRR